MELPKFEEEEDEDEMQNGEEMEDGEETELPVDEVEPSLSLATPPYSLELHYSKRQIMKNEQAEKLDVMMTVCLQHFHAVCHHKNGG